MNSLLGIFKYDFILTKIIFNDCSKNKNPSSVLNNWLTLITSKLSALYFVCFSCFAVVILKTVSYSPRNFAKNYNCSLLKKFRKVKIKLCVSTFSFQQIPNVFQYKSAYEILFPFIEHSIRNDFFLSRFSFKIQSAIF